MTNNRLGYSRCSKSSRFFNCHDHQCPLKENTWLALLRPPLVVVSIGHLWVSNNLLEAIFYLQFIFKQSFISCILYDELSFPKLFTNVLSLMYQSPYESTCVITKFTELIKIWCDLLNFEWLSNAFTTHTNTRKFIYCCTKIPRHVILIWKFFKQTEW